MTITWEELKNRPRAKATFAKRFRLRLHRYYHYVADRFDRLTHGFVNLVRWAPVIWRDQDWDWVFLADLMEYKLRWMVKYHQNHGHLINSARYARQMRVCADLLARMKEDEYFDKAYEIFTARGVFAKDDYRRIRIAGKQASDIRNNDQKLLGSLIGKYLNHWWD